ncbi:MAG: hypothetical protein IPP12_00390 [Nitrospira sp.]|nr:hypothetical protein [Nitrospira sp.]
MIAFSQFDTMFLLKPEDARKFKEGDKLYLFRAGARVCETPVTVVKTDDCIGFLSEQRSGMQDGQARDDLRKEVKQ